MAERPAPAEIERLLRLLRMDDLDGAIDAGLMTCDLALAGNASDRAAIASARNRLADAWAARDRYRARSARLARRKAEREAERAAGAASRTGTSGLPAAAAAALARAKAKAATKS
jgi:hypothetical protein